MNRRELGQGLVEYPLILVIVAVVVIAILLQLGPEIDNQFCEVLDGLGGTRLELGDHEVVMGIDDDYIDIDVKPQGAAWTKFVCKWRIRTPASHGTVTNNNDGTYTYYPNVVGSGRDDHFEYQVSFKKKISGQYNGYGDVTIIIGERDEQTEPAALEKSSDFIKKQSTVPKLDDVEEQILTLYEAAKWQEESIKEGTELNIESFVEGVEVLVNYAEDAQNQLFYENLTLFQQAAENGNWGAMPDIYDSIDFSETPHDVYAAMYLKMAPRLIAACEVVSSGIVPSEVIENALQAAQEMDDNYPNKIEILQSLQDAVNIIETRNFFIQEHTIFQADRIDGIIDLLDTAGYSEIAEQLAVESEVCGD